MTETNAWAMQRISALDMIFACTVCQIPLSCIKNDREGLHGDNDSDEHKVAKLWFAVPCAHLSCAKHFEGGGKFILYAGSQTTDSQGQVFLSIRKDSFLRRHVLTVSRIRTTTPTGCFITSTAHREAIATPTFLTLLSKPLILCTTAQEARP